jgi:sRNA-binding carbon storage regulator CsrA
MLVLTRRPGESFVIRPDTNASVSDPLGWFARPIEVRILKIEGKHVRVGIEAAGSLLILRGEKIEVG